MSAIKITKEDSKKAKKIFEICKKLPLNGQKHFLVKCSLNNSKAVMHEAEDLIFLYNQDNYYDSILDEFVKENPFTYTEKLPEGFEQWSKRQQRRAKQRLRRIHKKKKLEQRRVEMSKKLEDELIMWKLFHLTKGKYVPWGKIPKNIKPITKKQDDYLVNKAYKILNIFRSYQEHPYSQDIYHNREEQELWDEIDKRASGKYWYLFVKPKIKITGKTLEEFIENVNALANRKEPEQITARKEFTCYRKDKLPEVEWNILKKTKRWVTSLLRDPKRKVKDPITGHVISVIARPLGNETLQHSFIKNEIAKYLPGSKLEYNLPDIKDRVDVYYEDDNGKTVFEVQENKQTIAQIKDRIDQFKQHFDYIIFAVNPVSYVYFKDFKQEGVIIKTYEKLLKSLKKADFKPY